MEEKTFAERLKDERLLKGWSKKTVCERIPGTSYVTYSWWEAGRSEPSPLMQRLFIEELRRV